MVHKTDDCIELSIAPSHGNGLTLTYHGTERRAWCDVVSAHPALPQRVFVNVPLRRGVWPTLTNALRQARLGTFPLEEPCSGWMVLDGATYTLRVHLGDERHQLVRTRPEPRLARAINQLLDACPVLEGHDGIKLQMRCDEATLPEA